MKQDQGWTERLKGQLEGFRPQLEKLPSLDDLRAEKLTGKLSAKLSVRAVHQTLRRLTRQFDETGPDMKQIDDLSFAGPDGDITARLYTPHGAVSDGGPAFVYIHGGGWVTGSIDSHEAICLRIASGSALRVLSVEYRLAPDHPFPAAIDDCEAALNWVLSGQASGYGIDAGRIAIGGDSAGGNMTAFLAQKYRTQLKAQILFYPVMQMLELKPQKPGPQDRLQLGFVALKFIEEHYLVGADKTDTKVSPLLEDKLTGLPPAYVLTAGLDPLRHEGRAYQEKMRAVGIKVDYRHEKAMPHGFLNFARAFPRAKRVTTEVADFLRQHI